MDGWFNEGDQNKQHAGSSSSTTPGADRLFDQYRRSFCSVESGCVDPGLADKEGLDYLEIEESRCATSTATQLPQRLQFYRPEAGTKTAIFMGCTSGSEIDIGLPTTSNINVQMGTRPSLFSDEFIQQYSPRLGEIFPAHEQSWPSSSSSSLRSVSVGSPEYYSNSLIMTTASTSSRAPPVDTAVSTEAAPTDHQHEPTRAMAPAAAPPQVTAPMKAYGPQTRRRVQYFPTPAADDAAMASAMLAVISASSDPSPSSSVHPSALSSSHGLLQAPQVMMEGGRRGRAFRSYNPAALAPRAVEAAARRFSHGQRMIKTAHEILRQVGAMSVSPMRVPTSNQLHHMIAERKRREKLNESFTALRMLLPQGTKKDKASILTKAKECLNSLKAQISELEEKNRLMEARLSRADDAAEEAARPAAGERVRIQVVRSPASSSSDQSTVRIQLRVTVWAECDTLDLVLPILECVKEMGNASVASLQADDHSSSAQTNPVRRATVTLRIEGGEWDEGAFKESVAKAVDGALRTPQTSPAAAAAAAHHEKLRLL